MHKRCLIVHIIITRIPNKSIILYILARRNCFLQYFFFQYYLFPKNTLETFSFVIEKKRKNAPLRLIIICGSSVGWEGGNARKRNSNRLVITYQMSHGTTFCASTSKY